jgi:hypothetical protein
MVFLIVLNSKGTTGNQGSQVHTVLTGLGLKNEKPELGQTENLSEHIFYWW